MAEPMSECEANALSERAPASESKGYFVYLAELGDGRFYVGVTNDLERRPVEHASGKPSTRTTRVFGFRRIVYAERHEDRVAAYRRERQLKGWSRAKKRALATGGLGELKALARRRTRGSPPTRA